MNKLFIPETLPRNNNLETFSATFPVLEENRAKLAFFELVSTPGCADIRRNNDGSVTITGEKSRMIELTRLFRINRFSRPEKSFREWLEKNGIPQELRPSAAAFMRQINWIAFTVSELAIYLGATGVTVSGLADRVTDIQSDTAIRCLWEAASLYRWQDVSRLLDMGVDPSRRLYDSIDNLPPLYFAFQACETEIAVRLYECGDRLDDLNMTGLDTAQDWALNLIQRMTADGLNLFRNDGKTLSQCCFDVQLVQAEELLSHATQQEKDKALRTIFTGMFGHTQKLPQCVDFFPKLLEAGARIDVPNPDPKEWNNRWSREELLSLAGTIRNWPIAFCPSRDAACERLEKLLSIPIIMD